jgi:hypothetical protein
LIKNNYIRMPSVFALRKYFLFFNSVFCGRSVVFSGYSSFFQQYN